MSWGRDYMCHMNTTLQGEVGGNPALGWNGVLGVRVEPSVPSHSSHHPAHGVDNGGFRVSLEDVSGLIAETLLGDSIRCLLLSSTPPCLS